MNNKEAKMRNLLLALLACTTTLMLVACGHETATTVPVEGVVEYDIMYSGNIKANNITCSMLPSKIKCRYNKDGFKLSSQAGLGMAKLSIVATSDDSYMTMDINGDKYLAPFAKLFTEEDYQRRNTQIKLNESEETEIVAGWESKLTTAVCQSPIGEVRIDTYYVPEPRLNRELKDSPIPNVPGLITALKITNADSNVIIILSDIYTDKVSSDEFIRPTAYCNRETNRENIDSLIISNLPILSKVDF